MKIPKANKIVAKFMGWNDSGDYHVARKMEPFLSLDALVPVWRKLDMPNILEMDIRSHHYASAFGMRTYADLSYVIYEDSSTSIQEAALIATARAIQELEE